MLWRVAAWALVTCGAVVWATPTPACTGDNRTKYLFCDPTQEVDLRVEDLISRLLPEEKPPLLTARSDPKDAVSRLGVPSYDWGTNCLHGVATLLPLVQSECGTKNGQPNCPTSFPGPTALGASFNMSLVEGMGHFIGVELRSLWLQGVKAHGSGKEMGLDCWSPNINMYHDPRWGRNQETSGEDPFLNGLYGAAYTRGLQWGRGNVSDARFLQAVVTLKHYTAYGLESYGGHSRHSFNAVVPAYDLQDSFLTAWRMSVMDGGALGVMCSYNCINGIPNCASAQLNKVLRDTWGFQGYITSDSGAISDIYHHHHYVNSDAEGACVAIKDGQCDIDSCWPPTLCGPYADYLLKGVENGNCSILDVDEALRHTLRLRFRLGLFDPIEDQAYWKVPPEAVNTVESQALSTLGSLQGMVLLKNEKNTLPLAKGKKVAVIGPHTNATSALLGNYIGKICPSGHTDCVKTPLAAIAAANAGGRTTSSRGCDVTGSSTSGFAEAESTAKAADVVVMMLGIDTGVENEAHDRSEIDLPSIQHKLVEAVMGANPNTVIVLVNGGQLAIAEEKETVPAIVEAFYPGFQGADAIAAVLFGDYNPGGKMPYTIYNANYTDEVSMYNYEMAKAPGRSYRYYTGTPLYPFGWGLSYTTFSLAWAGGASSDIHLPIEGGIAPFAVSVSNTGSRGNRFLAAPHIWCGGGTDGDEVVMAFFEPVDVPSQPDNPLLRQLFAFQRVGTTRGQSQTVNFTVSPQQLALVNKSGDRIMAPGKYQLIVSNGVDAPLTRNVFVDGPTEVVLERLPPA